MITESFLKELLRSIRSTTCAFYLYCTPSHYREFPNSDYIHFQISNAGNASTQQKRAAAKQITGPRKVRYKQTQRFLPQ